MPDLEPKPRVHPFKAAKAAADAVRAACVLGDLTHAAAGDGGPGLARAPEFVELLCTSNYTFLTGASHPEELSMQAALYGYHAVGIADTNTLAGVVRAHCGAKDAIIPHRIDDKGIRCVVGSRLVLESPKGLTIAAYPTTRAGYGRLCTLLTRGKRRAEKGQCVLTLDDVAAHAQDLVAIAIPDGDLRAIATGRDGDAPSDHGLARLAQHMGVLREIFDEDRLSLAACVRYGADDRAWLDAVSRLGSRFGVPLVASNDVLYQIASRRPLQDVLTCIRLGTTIERAGLALLANAERHLKTPHEMARLFAHMPNALARSVAIARRTEGFSLDQLRYEYPDEVCPQGVSATAYLRELTIAGAKERYPNGVPDAVWTQVEHELALIGELKYEAYFLTVHDIVRFARSRDILCQGRGAAANSAVCYCLGITCVDPSRISVLFERFVSKERNEPPDIDIDFEHERREEVIQYIYGKYGRDRAALTAEVISYRGRSAIRDVGKAMGLSLDCVDALAKTLGWWERGEIHEFRLRELGLDPNDRTLRQVLTLANQIYGFPRHLSQHVGGFVITRGALCESVPIENAAMPDRTVIEWDKDDIDAMGMLKVDCLGLGMLTCIRKAMALVNQGAEVSGCEGGKKTGGEASRCQGGEYLSSTVTSAGTQAHGTDSLVSRPDRVAEEQGARDAGVRVDRADAAERAVRPDDANASCGDLDSVKHRRGIQPQDATRVHPWVANRERLAGGAVHAVGTGHRDADDARGSTRDDSPERDRSHDLLADQTPGSQGEAIATHVDASAYPSAPSVSAPCHLDTSTPSTSTPLLQLHTIPAEDPTVYDMMCKADTIGVFQIESRAQMSMLPRMRPRCFYDLVIEVAIVRPGPIQGNMVHPYLRRRAGEEPVTYPDDAVRKVLGRTLGVPLFQEQAMALAIVAAGFTPGEADQLRRAMAAWKRKGDLIYRFGQKIVEGMIAKGYGRDFAERCFEQIKGFSEYGFPESHAASFALLVYASAWLKKHHPAAFAAALLNSQPMGFYAPAQIVRDAREHGVFVREIDVNHSDWDCTLEGSRTMRLGMRLAKSMREDEARAIAASRAARGAFTSIPQLRQRSGVSVGALRALAKADAFASLGMDRQHALWTIQSMRDDALPLFDQREEDLVTHAAPDPRLQVAACEELSTPDPLDADARTTSLPSIAPHRLVHQDYAATGLSLKAHPISFLRDRLNERKVVLARDLADSKRTPNGRRISVAGLVLVRQRPGTASGIVFITMEDETGIANLIVRPAIFEKFRSVARMSVALLATGRVERANNVVHVLVSKLESIDAWQPDLVSRSRDFH